MEEEERERFGIELFTFCWEFREGGLSIKSPFTKLALVCLRFGLKYLFLVQTMKSNIANKQHILYA